MKSNIELGGFWCHFRDDFKRCNWAFVTSQVSGTTMNMKELKEGADQWMWRPAVKRGAGKGCYHLPDQCNLTDNEIEIASGVVGAK